MITALVQFKLPQPVTREKAQQLFVRSRPAPDRGRLPGRGSERDHKAEYAHPPCTLARHRLGAAG